MLLPRDPPQWRRPDRSEPDGPRRTRSGTGRHWALAAQPDAQRHVANAKQAVARHPIDRPLGFEGFDPRQELGESQPHLHAGEARSQADMRTEAEGHVTVWRTADVEAKWLVEHSRIAIGRHLPVGDLVAGLDAMPLVGHLARRRAALVDRGRGPAQDLVAGD